MSDDLIKRSDAIKAVDETPFMRRPILPHYIKAKINQIPSAEPKPVLTEEVREAIMRLTMCAREECGMCKHKDTCDFDFQYETATRCMNILADALRKTEPNCSEKPNNSTISKMEQVDKDTNVRSKAVYDKWGNVFDARADIEDEPSEDCELCKHFKYRHPHWECEFDTFEECNYEPKTEPQTDIHDFTDCDFCKDRNCKDCEGGKDEPQTDEEPSSTCVGKER